MCRVNRTETLYTHEEVTKNIDEKGRMLLIYDGKILDVTKFAAHHPGGELVMQHAMHRDATALIRVFHRDDVIEKKLPSFVVGTLDPASAALQTKGQKFQPTTDQDFLRLYKTIESNGWFRTNMWYYYTLWARLAVIFATFVALVLYGPNHFASYMVAAFINGVFFHQSAFVGHDTGHAGITQNLKMDNIIGLIFGNALGGISMAWWKKSHYVHHVATNHPEHDPDIQHAPIFAVTSKLLGNLYSTYHKRIMHFDKVGEFLVSIQHFLYYPIMAVARFNLYAQSLLLLAFDEKVLWREWEIAALGVFYTWLTLLVMQLPDLFTMVCYVLLSHAVTVLLHVQITLSHFAMCTEEFGQDGEPFCAHQLRTTMDVDCPPWMDWFHGGLQFQVEHHLFPRLPRHNLRKIMPLVKEFCKKHGLPYHTHTFVQGNRIVVGGLRDVANHVGLLMEASAAEAKRMKVH